MMDIYNFSSLQDEARKVARRFGEREIVHLTRDLDRHPPKFPLDLYRKMAEAGFLGYTASPEVGGAGKTWLEYATLIEELSSFDASTGFILSIGNLAMSPIELFGNENQKQTFLPGMIRGDLIGAFALTEPDVGSDATNMKTRALLDGEGFLVDGEKRFISTGDVADLVILVCKVYREGDEGQLST